MTRPIVRDPIYRRRRFDAEIIELCVRWYISLDGTKGTIVAEWRSIADYEAMRADPTSRPCLERALGMANFEPGMYEVVVSFAPPP
jgi:hypothetical protein